MLKSDMLSATPDLLNTTEIKFSNLLDEDPLGEEFWRNWLGSARFRQLRRHFSALGESGALATELSARADKQGPTLETHDARGLRIDRVVHHPDYHELEKLSYGRGIVGIKYDPEFLAKHREFRHLVGFGAGYYFAQSEIGLYCPICMTDGVGRVLERRPEGPQTPLYDTTIAHLATSDLSKLWQGAMFLTERQGGSDVGANAVTATPHGERWLLNGDKWFCSNVAADAILALARMPGGAPGTKGLGLFLALRQNPAGNSATIRIHRLKDKLGVRSMATGEVTFENTEAFLIAGENEGFKQMTEMLNLSRLYNAVASVAGMRRALLEALKYGSGRKAFGHKLDELPLWRAAMADLVAEHLGIFALVFETVRALDAADNGDETARKLMRIAIPMAKALSGKLAVFAVSEAMEAIGGNAYIEESILPRLLRNCQVLPIWEGTTHILTLDALRAIQKEGSREALFARIRLALDRAEGIDIAPLQTRLAADIERLDTLLKLPDELQQREARQWLESVGRTFTLALLLENATHEPLRGSMPCRVQKASRAPYRRHALVPWQPGGTAGYRIGVDTGCDPLISPNNVDMNDFKKTKVQLVQEITELRKHCSTLEIAARERDQLAVDITDARNYAESIVESVREPLVVLGSDLKILSANHSFYDTFKVTPEDTAGNFIYDLGNRQWDIPKLRMLLEDILPSVTVFNGYEVEHEFLNIGRKVILLNAREIFRKDIGSHIILLAMEDITERRQMEAQIRELAFYDALTKLPNRRLLNDRLSQAMAASQRSSRYCALLFLDLDNFKPLNDTHGHGAGDLLLIEVAHRLKQCVREIDTVARFGGDEFVVILNELSVDKAEATSQTEIVAEKIRTSLSAPYSLVIKHDVKPDTAIEHHCTASIGMALFIDHMTSQDDIIKLADTAMYQAKESFKR